MLLDFDTLVNKYNLKINGVIQIGAHYCEEHNTYLKHGIDNFMYFEPDPNSYNVIMNKLGGRSNVQIHNYALGNTNNMMKFNVSSNESTSSSLLKPKLHLKQHPHVKFVDTIDVEVRKLNDFEVSSDFNFINIDVQGYELEVFKGADKHLENIDYIMSEVNRDETYEGNGLIDDVDSFLSEFGFVRVETSWDGVIWGDAFYIKKT